MNQAVARRFFANGILASLAVAYLSVTISPLFGDDQKHSSVQTVADVIQRFIGREQAVNALDVAVTQTASEGDDYQEYVLGRYIADCTLVEFSGSKQVLPSKEDFLRQNERLKDTQFQKYQLSKGCIRVEATHNINPVSAQPELTTVIVYDGKEWHSFKLNESESVSILREDDVAEVRPEITLGYDLPFPGNVKLTGTWRSMSAMMSQVASVCEVVVESVASRSDQSEDAELLLLRWSIPMSDPAMAAYKGRVDNDLLVSPALSYSPIEYRYYDAFPTPDGEGIVPGSAITTYRWSHYEKFDDGVFIPARFVVETTKTVPTPKRDRADAFASGTPKYSDFDYPRFRVHKVTASISVASINRELPPELFDNSLRDGTSVYDARTGTRYIVGGGVDPDMERLMAEQAQRSPTSVTKLAKEQNSINRGLLAVNAVVLLGIILFFCFKEKKRGGKRKGENSG